MSDGSVISETVRDGRIHHYRAGPAGGEPLVGRQEYREARIFDDDERMGVAVGADGFGRMLEMASSGMSQK